MLKQNISGNDSASLRSCLLSQTLCTDSNAINSTCVLHRSLFTCTVANRASKNQCHLLKCGHSNVHVSEGIWGAEFFSSVLSSHSGRIYHELIKQCSLFLSGNCLWTMWALPQLFSIDNYLSNNIYEYFFMLQLVHDLLIENIWNQRWLISCDCTYWLPRAVLVPDGMSLGLWNTFTQWMLMIKNFFTNNL